MLGIAFENTLGRPLSKILRLNPPKIMAPFGLQNTSPTRRIETLSSMPSLRLRPHSDLDRFAQEFHDEAHLRTVLHDLLLKMGARGVRITHGINERGKDLIFYMRGGLSKDVLYACVVKKDRISGRADSGGGAQTVLNQALQALSEPYTDPMTGKEQRAHSVYVISPHDCTPEAVESIKHQLRVQARRVEFICGIDLLTLFQQHWSDFLRFESAILTRYLSSLSAGLSVDNALIALLTRHNANLGLKPFESFYVPNDIEIRTDSYQAPETPLPWATALDQHLTWEELQETAARLRFWRQALRSSELTGQDPQMLRLLLNFVDHFGKETRKYWDQALKTKKVRQIGSKARQDFRVGPEERKLEVPGPFRELYHQCIAVLDPVNQQLIKIAKASTALRKAANKSLGATPQLLSNSEFCFTSAAYDYLNVIPGLLQQKAGKRWLVDPSALFSSCRAVLLSGPPGSGKTSFCRWQTLRAIERFSADQNQPLPVYVSAHRIASSALRGFEQTFLGGVDVMELWSEREQKLSVSIRLFLDGLDEVPDRDQQRRMIELLKDGMEKYPRLVALITSRPYVWGSWLNWLPRVHMAELKPAEQRILAERWLDEQNQVTEFFNQLDASPALRRLMGVPLLATLILNLYRKTPTIPENKASLYRAFVDLYSGGWDVAKGIYKAGRFSNEQKLRPLPGLAYRMHLSHRADCSEGMFSSAVNDTIPALASRASDLLAEIIQDGILVRVGQDLLFAHLSFQEYLAALYLSSDPKGIRPAQALSRYLRGEDWWKEVVEFYLISRDDPATLDDWIGRASHWAGTKARADEDRDLGNSILGRLDALANAMTESFPGYSPRFNRLAVGRQRQRRRVVPDFLVRDS